MLHIHAIPAFEDNYIWLLQKGRHVVVVDPGDAEPVIDYCEKNNLLISAILITHHHADHIGGVNQLLVAKQLQVIQAFDKQVPVYAPCYEQFHFKHTPLSDGDSIYLTEIDTQFNIMWLPGHTLGHIAFVNDDYLFCGDVLFGAGCGRLFEGTPAQMLASLNRLKQLNTATKVFCTHEYTAKNIDFALTLEPDNTQLLARKLATQHYRQQQIPSLPSNIKLELQTNPFLRCNEASIIQHSNAENSAELSVFTAIRNLRNHY